MPQGQNSELQFPMNPQLNDTAAKKETNDVDYQYVKQQSSIADREIASTFNKNEDPVAEVNVVKLKVP